MRVAVTGGSGVVGSALIRHLVAAEHEVHALARTDQADKALTVLGAIPIRGDILSPETLTEAFSESSVVFHVAGVNQMCMRDPAPMMQANVEGSRNVISAARHAGAARVVYTSSAAALGEKHGTIGTERSQHRGSFLSAYEESKYLAEIAVWEMAEDIEIVSVNPSSVQGPGRATGTGKLILDVINGKLPALVDTHLSIVDIDDCARAHILAAERGVPGERYVLNSFTVSTREALVMLESALDRDLKTRVLPPWVVRPLGPIIDLLHRLGMTSIPVCGEMIATVANGHRYDGSRAETELGLSYTPAHDVINRLVTWFLTEGLITPR